MKCACSQMGSPTPSSPSQPGVLWRLYTEEFQKSLEKGLECPRYVETSLVPDRFVLDPKSGGFSGSERPSSWHRLAGFSLGLRRD